MPRRTLLTLLVALTALVGLAGPASAHDVLTGTSPGARATVKTMPAQVKLTFNEAVLGIGSAVRVEGADGDIATGKAKVVDNTVSQPVAPDAPAGDYTVTWRVTSADGHPISGKFSFTTTQGPATEETTQAAAPDQTTTTTTPAPTTAATAVASDVSTPAGSGSPSPWVWVVIALVVVAVVAGAVVLIRRRPAGQ